MRTNLTKVAVRTSLLYAVIAGLWILLSDRLLVTIVSDPATIGRLSMYKGWFFVAVTAVLLYAMLHNQLRRWEKEAAGRMAAEEDVRRSETYLAETQRLTHTGSWAFDLFSNKYIYVSEESLRTFELDPQDELPTREAISRLIHPEDLDSVQASFEKTLRERVDTSTEFRIALPSGTAKHIHAIQHPILNDAGEVVQVVGTVIDITERKQAEQEIVLLSFALDNVRDVAAFLIDDRGRFQYVNEEACRGLGYSRAELLAMSAPDIDPEFPAERWSNHWGDLQTHRSLRFESRHRTRDGRIFPVEISANYIEYGGRAYNLALVRNITERKRAEEALRRSEAYLAEAQRLNHTGTFVSDKTTKPLYWSEELFRIFGFDPQQGLPTRDQPLQRIHPEDLDKFRQAFQRTIHQKVDSDVEYRILLPDGTIKHVYGLAHPVLNASGELVETVGTVVDITERKRAEEERHKSAERFRAIADYTYDWENWIGVDGKLLWVNPAVERITGYSVGECMVMPDFPIPIIAEADREMVARQIREAAQGSSRNDLEFRVRHRDGHLAWVAASWQPIYDQKGASLGYRSSIRDIAERKRAERVVQARLRLLEFAGSHSMDEFLTATLDEIEVLTGSSIGFYHFLESDQLTLSLQSWSTNTLKSMCTAGGKGSHYNVAEAGVWVDCVHQRRPVIHNDYASLSHRKGMPQGHAKVCREVVSPIFRRDKIVAILGIGNKLTDYDPSDIEILSQVGDLSWDIVERKRAEEALQKVMADLEERVKERTKELSEANEALQTANKELESFSYSVSHDLRAPLLTIDGFSRMVLKRYADKLDDDGMRKLNVICSSTKHMSELIDDLLAFSRLGRKEMVKASLDMDALVRSAWKELTMLNPERRIQFSVKCLPRASGDQTLIKEVVVNLLSNAIKFTKVRETALIEVGAYPEEERNVYFFRDNGVGFDMHYYNKLFGVFQRLHSAEEFEGTGVGLAIVQRIIRRHGGRVWAEGKLGEGATFYFTLIKKE